MTRKKTLLQHFISCITEKYFTFSGRASRSEYWAYVLFNLIFGVLPQLTFWALGISARGDTLFYYVQLFFEIFFIIPTIAVGVRRFHDTNKSGLFPIIFGIISTIPNLVTYVNYFFSLENKFELPPFLMSNNFQIAYLIIFILAVLYYLYVSVIRGTEGSNPYGLDPLNPEIEDEVDQIGMD